CLRVGVLLTGRSRQAVLVVLPSTGTARDSHRPGRYYPRGASTSSSSTHVSGYWCSVPVCQGPSRMTTSSSPSTGMQRHSPPGGSEEELPPPNWKKSACRRPSFVPSTCGQS